MAKLCKNYYRTAKGDRRINSFVWMIPKRIVKEADIDVEKEVHVHAEDGKIVLEQDKG